MSWHCRATEHTSRQMRYDKPTRSQLSLPCRRDWKLIKLTKNKTKNTRRLTYASAFLTIFGLVITWPLTLWPQSLIPKCTKFPEQFMRYRVHKLSRHRPTHVHKDGTHNPKQCTMAAWINAAGDSVSLWIQFATERKQYTMEWKGSKIWQRSEDDL